MKDRRRFLILFAILTAVTVAVGGAAIGILYRTALKEQESRLIDAVRTQARIIEAVASYQLSYEADPANAEAATLAQIRDAQERLHEGDLQNTGEFILARRRGDDIAFVWRRHGEDFDKPESIPFQSTLAEPMRRALSGRSGSMIGPDYRGTTVLAAYEPVAVFDLGVVAKINLAEVSAPFVRAGLIVVGIAVALIGIGTKVFFSITDPIVRHLREGEVRFRELFDNMGTGGAVYYLDKDEDCFVFSDLNRAGERILRLDRTDVIGHKLTEVLPGIEEFGLPAVLRRVWQTGRPERIPPTFYTDDRIEGWWENSVYRLPSGDVVSLFEDVTDRMRAERALRDSEERFRRISQSASDAIVSIDADGMIVSWNEAAERIFDYGSSEMIGQPLSRIIPERFRNLHKEGLKRIAAGGGYHVIGKTVELEGLRADGTEVPIELALSTWTMGRNRFYTGLLRDISERQATEHALRESEAQLRSIIDLEFVAIVIVDEASTVEFVNPAAEVLFGKPSEHLMGAQLGVPIVADEASEIEIVRSDGSIRQAEMRVTTMMWQGKESYLLSIRDVTSRKRAEDELRKLTRAIEQSPASVVITDVNGTIEYVNPKFCEVTGYGYEEALGKNPRILKSGNMTPAEYEVLWKTISSGSVWTGEFHNVKKDGEPFWELASIAPVRDRRGEITHFVAVKEDITERKATEERLRQAQKMEVIGQLTGGIAHDFNNFLAIIVGNLQLLEEELSEDDDNRELITDAIWSAERGAELTRRLLAFARRQQLHPEATDLNKTLRAVTKLLQRTLGERIEVRTDLAEELSEAMIDRGQLETSLVNLAVNARDAMPDGGVLTITTKNVVLGEDAVEVGGAVALSPGEYAMIAVSDTGVGMSEKVLNRIFEPFFTTKRFGQGSGLGLSMVYGFVRQSGGSIAVESEAGQGTIIRLYLPRAVKDAHADDATVEAATAGTGGGEVILVVEDDDRVRRTAVSMLLKQGYRVEEAHNSAAALDIVARAPRIDLLFTDVVLPDGLNGPALAREVLGLRPDVRVLLTSGYAFDEGEADTGEPHFRLLPKPYRRGDLANTIRSVLDEPPPHIEVVSVAASEPGQ